MVQSVIIQSIGDAGPNVSGILSEAFGLPKEVFLKLLYQTPSVLFKDVEAPVAQQAHDLLSQLGLDVQLRNAEHGLPEVPEPVEVAVYVPELTDLSEVVRNLAAFIGCEQKLALNLLLKEPAIVLGGVSEATALALAKRIPAEVTFTRPKQDHFWIRFLTDDKPLREKVLQALPAGVWGKNGPIADLNYDQCHHLWRKIPAEGLYELVNRRFARFEIILDRVDDTRKAKYEPLLVESVGIPAEILPAVLADLPVQLHESVSRAEMESRMALYAQSGMVCSARELPIGVYHIHIKSWTDPKKARIVLGQFLTEKDLPGAQLPWVAPAAMSNLLCRYAVAQLQAIGCQAEVVEVGDGK